jgi:hypothetical protein
MKWYRPARTLETCQATQPAPTPALAGLAGLAAGDPKRARSGTTETADLCAGEATDTAASIASSAEPAATEALATYEALAPVADWPDSEREHLQSLSREMADGYLRAALRRPPSWRRAEAHMPTPGTTCSCCGGRQWWSRDELGWCCATCHPPDHLASDAVTEFMT